MADALDDLRILADFHAQEEQQQPDEHRHRVRHHPQPPFPHQDPDRHSTKHDSNNLQHYSEEK